MYNLPAWPSRHRPASSRITADGLDIVQLHPERNVNDSVFGLMMHLGVRAVLRCYMPTVFWRDISSRRHARRTTTLLYVDDLELTNSKSIVFNCRSNHLLDKGIG